MPFYQSHIDSLDNLQYVVRLVDGFDQNRYLAALAGKRHISNEQLERMRLHLDSARIKLDEEMIGLTRFGETFNALFTTSNNTCFSSAMSLLNRIRSGMSALVEFFLRFAPQTAAQRRANAMAASAASADNAASEPSLYEHSAMAGADYTLPLFDIEHYSPQVQALFQTLKDFMHAMSAALRFCEGILAEEELIRQDADECHARYAQFKESHARVIKDFIHSINITTDEFTEERNPAIRLRNQSRDERDFSQRGFHNLSVSATAALASKELVEEAMRGEFTQTELWLFPGERTRIHRIRYIIRHFDRFLPEGYSRKTLPTPYIACLMWWSQAIEDKAFVNYFTQTYTDAQGAHKPPANNSVNQAKRREWNSDTTFCQLIQQWENVEIS